MKNIKYISVIIFLVILIATPFILPNYILYLINLSAIAAIAAIGLNILTGYTGLIAIANGAFLGVGAYTAAILYTKIGIPFYLTIPAAGLITAIIGVLFGMPALRLRGFYLAMSTLAAQILLVYVFSNWEAMTNGVSGISIIPPSIFGIKLHGDRNFYFLTILIASISLVVSKNIFKTATGRAFIAIRDRDIAANIIGIDMFKYKLVSFAISSFFAGVAGSLYAYYMTYIAPDSFGFNVSIDYVAMIIVGGLGTIWGPVLGASFVMLLPTVVENLIALISKIYPMDYTFAAFRQVIFGLLIIVFLIFEPRGLYAIVERIGNSIRTKIFGRR